jgi:hypothetical protein
MTWVHIAWLSIPTTFFLGALWSFLESKSSSPKKRDPLDIAKQGLFVLACAISCITIDITLLPSIHEMVVGFGIPLGMLQFLLLPFVAIILAKLIGGSKPVTRSLHHSRGSGH